MEHRSEKVPPPIMALAINLATVASNARAFTEENGLKFFFKRAIKTRDSLLFKFLRTLSQHGESMHMLFLVISRFY